MKDKGSQMTCIDSEKVRQTFLDLSKFDVALEAPEVSQNDQLPCAIARLLTVGPGYCVCHSTNKVLARHDLDIREHREVAYALLETMFRNAMALIDVSKYCVIPHAMTISKMDVDGFNLNQEFSHDGNVQSRAFMTSKCIHFDAATPFIANIYGLNENIEGGHPLICDIRQFCRDHKTRAQDLVETIPNNYNIVLKENAYEVLKNEYSFGLDVDIDTDIIAVMLLNEIKFGIAHGATEPRKLIPHMPSKRPIRHLEYQYLEEAHYAEWYGFYGLPMLPANDYAGENLSLNYYRPGQEPFDRLISVNKVETQSQRFAGKGRESVGA
jgi:hypothetical protein